GNAGVLVSPPYDVIDEAMQQALYDGHANNVVRIIQGVEEDADSDAVNKYTRANDYLRGWLEDGALKHDEVPGIYVYAQDFEAQTPSGPVSKTRWGIVTLVRAEALGAGSILPHEHTMPGPKADRLELMRHTGAAFGQIFSLFSDPEHRVQKLIDPHVSGEALFSFADSDGVVHRFWQIVDEATIADIVEVLADKPLFIADGHHRYETAVTYCNERSEADGVSDAADQPYGYRMQTLVNMDDTEGLAVNPIHRVVVDLGSGGVASLESGLGEFFDLEALSLHSSSEVMQALQARKAGPPVFAMCAGNLSRVVLLTLKEGVDLAALDPESHSEAWRKLDTALLQLVLGKVLNLDTETLIKGEKVQFVKVEADVLKIVNAADDRAGFFLNATGMDQLREVVLNDERMPPKSTFFYPKVFSGLVIQDLNAF
ncbi:MAG: DUF1015 domain-containing protein, partial [Candidatus Latescibacteria bacterium]|nr:DUF1015 domain-containing protein [Candidatus Latescibacterota bacterium]